MRWNRDTDAMAATATGRHGRLTENDADVHRGVEALVLIKNEGVWQIVSQAWDTESESNPNPVHLVGGMVRE